MLALALDREADRRDHVAQLTAYWPIDHATGRRWMRLLGLHLALTTLAALFIVTGLTKSAALSHGIDAGEQRAYGLADGCVTFQPLPGKWLARQRLAG
jgi:hypothetical protein